MLTNESRRSDFDFAGSRLGVLNMATQRQLGQRKALTANQIGKTALELSSGQVLRNPLTTIYLRLR
jgi:hypothetical protein